MKVRGKIPRWNPSEEAYLNELLATEPTAKSAYEKFGERYPERGADAARQHDRLSRRRGRMLTVGTELPSPTAPAAEPVPPPEPRKRAPVPPPASPPPPANEEDLLDLLVPVARRFSEDPGLYEKLVPLLADPLLAKLFRRGTPAFLDLARAAGELGR